MCKVAVMTRSSFSPLPLAIDFLFAAGSRSAGKRNSAIMRAAISNACTDYTVLRRRPRVTMRLSLSRSYTHHGRTRALARARSGARPDREAVWKRLDPAAWLEGCHRAGLGDLD